MMRPRHLLIAILVAVSALALSASQSFPQRKSVLDRHRAAYGPLINQAEAGALLNAVAWELRNEGFALLRKDGGNSCPVQGLSVRISCDWLVHVPTGTGCDVLGAGPDAEAPGPSTPQWCTGDPIDTGRIVYPVAPPTTPEPGPEPGTPGQGDLADMLKRIEALEARPTGQDPRVDDLLRKLSEGVLTSREWGHAHRIKVVLQ